MTQHHHHHDGAHDHEHEDGEMFGMAFGFRIVEEGGKLFLAEVEVSPYTDAPEELGATLVFHPLEGIDPTDESAEEDVPAWTVDIDDELTRDPGADMRAQFLAVMRQLYDLSEADLRGYLRQAQQEG